MTPAEQQRKDALERANEVRVANSRWKDKVRAMSPSEGAAVVAEFLRSPSSPGDAMSIAHAVLCVPRLGAHKSGLIFRRAQIVNAQRAVRDVSERQRLVVAAELVAHSRRWERKT